jgi:cellulose synthase/poly-beta-1,6-N-acetylglucosamine synthase-like glycosyltransferase
MVVLALAKRREQERSVPCRAKCCRHDGCGLGAPLHVDWLRDPELRRPTVSIVIPTYNGSAFLTSCLRGLRETLPRAYEVEVIVVDDASNDDTSTVLSAWAALDDRVRSIAMKRTRAS